MRVLRVVCCALAVLLVVNTVWAQEVDKEALKARSKEVSKEMEKIRRKLRKNPEVEQL